MKRTAAYPERRSSAEMKLNSQKEYDKMVKHPSKINPIFLEKSHYGLEGAITIDRSQMHSGRADTNQTEYQGK